MQTKRHLLLFLIFLFGVTPAIVHAQQKLKFDIVKFELNQLDGTASNSKYQKIDGSGNPYAIIKVRSSDGNGNLNGFMFNFNSLKSIVENHDDELWVYVQKNAKIVTISRDGYTTLKNFDLGQTLAAGKTYNMEITFDKVKKTIERELHMQMLQFKITPAVEGIIIMYKKEGASDYELFGQPNSTTGIVSKNLPYGTYEYKIMSENYYATEGRVKLNSNSAVYVENVALKGNFSEVSIKSINAAANIFVNNEFKGKGSWKGTLNPGEYIIEGKLENHLTASQKITIVSGVGQTVELPSPTPITGFVSVTSEPTGATVEIDGKVCGTTPCNIKDVLIGTRQIKLTKANYNPVTAHVYVEEGKLSNINLEMDDALPATIKSVPTNASLYIDGNYVGTTPHTMDIKPGEYKITLKSKGYRNYNKTVLFNSENPVHQAKLVSNPMENNNIYLQGNFRYAKNSNYSATEFGGSIGAYIKKLNIQLDYFSNSDFTTKIDKEWYTANNLYIKDRFTLKVGSANVLNIKNTPIRLTPQIGCGYVKLEEKSGSEYAEYLIGVLAFRLDMHIYSKWGITLTPEYNFVLNKLNISQFFAEEEEDDCKKIINPTLLIIR